MNRTRLVRLMSSRTYSAGASSAGASVAGASVAGTSVAGTSAVAVTLESAAVSGVTRTGSSTVSVAVGWQPTTENVNSRAKALRRVFFMVSGQVRKNGKYSSIIEAIHLDAMRRRRVRGNCIPISSRAVRADVTTRTLATIVRLCKPIARASEGPMRICV